MADATPHTCLNIGHSEHEYVRTSQQKAAGGKVLTLGRPARRDRLEGP